MASQKIWILSGFYWYLLRLIIEKVVNEIAYIFKVLPAIYEFLVKLSSCRYVKVVPT